jgi:hypothetical protein
MSAAGQCSIGLRTIRLGQGFREAGLLRPVTTEAGDDIAVAGYAHATAPAAESICVRATVEPFGLGMCLARPRNGRPRVGGRPRGWVGGWVGVEVVCVWSGFGAWILG